MKSALPAKRLARRLLGPRSMSEVDIVYRCFRRDERGAVMIDVGAHYGESLWPFANDGWQVHAFEPDPVNRARLIEACRPLPNVTVVPSAVSDRAGELTLYRSQESSGISTLTAFSRSHEPAGIVDVTTLRTYIDQVGLRESPF